MIKIKPDRSGLSNQTASISAVIVNFNGGDCIINCIQALYRQEIPLRAIIVVDNGSSDGSVDQIRSQFPSVQLLELGRNYGLTVARNAGLRFSKTELVLLLDNDVYPAKDCLRFLLEALHETRATIACPRVILVPDGSIVQCDGAEAHFVGTMLLRHGYQQLNTTTPTERTLVGGCIGACMLLNRADVLAAGGFNETYFYSFEDLEFSLRLSLLGHVAVCEPAAVVYHDRGDGTVGLSFRGHGVYPKRRIYLQVRHRLMTMLIYYQVRTFIVLVPALICYELATLAVVLARGWGKEWVKAHLSLQKDAGIILKQRQYIQRVRCVADREILVGGPLPLAPGFIKSRPATMAAKLLSIMLNRYWLFAKRWIG